MYSRCTVNMMFPGAVGLYLCILLIPVLKIEAIPAITKTDTSIPYGIISQTTALTCTDSTYDPATSTFKFLKSGTEILNNIGEISTNGKYSATPSAGSIEMTIKDVAISDQTSYTCSVGFTSSPSSYSLEVEVKPTNDTTATVGVCTGPGNDNCGDKLTFTCTNLYPSPSDISVMDGTQTVVGANKSTTKPNGMFDLEWTATNSTSPKTYILTIAITTRSTYTITVENTINGPPTTTTTTTTTIPPTTTTESTTTSTTTPTTASTEAAVITTMPTTTTNEITTTPTATTTEAITTNTPTLTSETTDSTATNPSVSNESTVIIVVASTISGVVLVGLVVFLVGLFLYRARRHGHGKHKHNYKRNTRRQHSGALYIYSGPTNGQNMEMHPSMASFMDTRHGYPPSIKGYLDRRLGVDHEKQANGRHERSQMRNTNNVKSRYSVYPGNIVPYRNTQNFYPYHYPRHDECQRPATTGNIHQGHVNHAHQSSFSYRCEDYSDHWNMY